MADDLGRPDRFSTRGSTAAEVAQARFHGPTTLRESRVTTDTAAFRVLRNDPRRVFWVVANRGVAAGALGYGRDVTAANGFPLAALGGTVESEVDVDGEAVTYDVFGASGAAGETWYVYEVLRV